MQQCMPCCAILWQCQHTRACLQPCCDTCQHVLLVHIAVCSAAQYNLQDSIAGSCCTALGCAVLTHVLAKLLRCSVMNRAHNTGGAGHGPFGRATRQASGD